MLNFSVYELNTVCHELLHLWKTFLACYIFWGEGGGYTVSEIRSDLSGRVYVLRNLQCSMASPVYQPDSLCGAHGVFWITTLIPGGASVAWLYSNFPNISV